jgi:hypothetical protein
MLLRNHPLLNQREIRSWPPAWTWTSGGEKKEASGEIGILREVSPSQIVPADRCFLHIDHEGSTYIGCLLIGDQAVCGQIVKPAAGPLESSHYRDW